jgi:hypothetical protein
MENKNANGDDAAKSPKSKRANGQFSVGVKY